MAAQSAVSTDVYSRDTVYQRLRGQIIDFTLLPGELLSENALAAQMQTSRTPVREAIARLASEHCVEVFPQRGTQVSRISMELVRQAGATLVGVSAAIEKGFQGGGDELRRLGVKVESLAVIDAMDDTSITFRK